MKYTREFLGESHPQAYATATATLGTFPNIFTGTYTKSNEIKESFVEELNIPTIGITTNRLVSERYGYDIGFDSFTSPTTSVESGIKQQVASALPDGPLYELIARLYSFYQRFRPGETSKSFRRAESVISELQAAVGESEWFGWIHFMEPHHPYDPDETDLSRDEAQAISRQAIANGVEGDDAEVVRNLYKQEVIKLDRQLRTLWEWVPDGTRIIVTGDHGEMLGEDGIWGHPGILREETLHVPFATNIDLPSGPVMSSIDIPSIVMGEEYREGKFDRRTAYASHGDESAAMENGLIANRNGVFNHENELAERPSLKRKQERFEPSGIVKNDAIEDDLKDLGYI
jgi:hypothetical protein